MTTPTRPPRPRLGTCWFPEQWPRERWEQDVAGMVAAGLSVVRVGEFAWSWYEPRPGEHRFDGLDDAIGMLRDAGLDVLLCTPTATPPRWLTAAHPDVLAVTPDGRRRPPGSRRHTCPTSATYRELSDEVTTRLAARYGGVVAAWQLDNEPGNHDSARCWCDECEAAFRRWVAARYGDVGALNEAWGTAFWSATYSSFDEVELPRPTVTAQNPALELAHRRFASGQVVGFLARQRDTLRQVVPDAVTCTNEYADDPFVDPAGVARLHGVAAIDSYPHGTRGPLHTAYLLDLARGSAVPAGADAAADAGRAWVVEQQPGRINWTEHNAAVPPGQVRLWAWQALLHGIDHLLFFRWRAGVGGQEQYHAGLLRHDGERGPGWHDAQAVAAALAAGDLDGLLTRSPDVALVVDHDARWALAVEEHVDGAAHDDLVLPAYAALRGRGLDVDVVPPDVDLTGYPLVVAPGLHLHAPAIVARLVDALDAGATVVVGARSLVRTGDSGWVVVPEPGGLSDRLGARVVDAGAVGPWPDPSGVTTLATPDGPIAAETWAEQLAVEADDVEVLATHTDEWREGAPAAVRRGGLVYVGAAGAAVWEHVVGLLVTSPRAPGGREVFHRGDRTVVLDHVARTVEVRPADGVATVGGPNNEEVEP